MVIRVEYTSSNLHTCAEHFDTTVINNSGVTIIEDNIPREKYHWLITRIRVTPPCRRVRTAHQRRLVISRSGPGHYFHSKSSKSIYTQTQSHTLLDHLFVQCRYGIGDYILLSTMLHHENTLEVTFEALCKRVPDR